MARPSPIRGRALRRASTVVGVIALASVLGACSSGTEPVAQTLPPGRSGTGSTTVTTSHGSGTAPRDPEGTATIETFEIRNQISCVGEIDIETTATYETTGAASVSFLADGEQVRGTAPLSGSFPIPLVCDGRSHTVVLVAVDPDGGTTVDSRVVLTSTQPLGD